MLVAVATLLALNINNVGCYTCWKSSWCSEDGGKFHFNFSFCFGCLTQVSIQWMASTTGTGVLSPNTMRDTSPCPGFVPSLAEKKMAKRSASLVCLIYNNQLLQLCFCWLVIQSNRSQSELQREWRLQSFRTLLWLLFLFFKQLQLRIWTLWRPINARSGQLDLPDLWWNRSG